MTPATFVRLVQGRMIARGLDLGPAGADGVPGPRTLAALDHALPPAPSSASASDWPPPDERSLTAYYGPPGPAHLVDLDLPYPMRLAWDLGTTVQRARCHRLVAASLSRVLSGILRHYGSLEAVREARMDLFGGIFAHRRQRGGSAWSLHAWGAAIDLDPVRNGFRTPWPAQATMPGEVIEIFEAERWKSGARAWGRDAMHFQATR